MVYADKVSGVSLSAIERTLTNVRKNIGIEKILSVTLRELRIFLQRRTINRRMNDEKAS